MKTSPVIAFFLRAWLLIALPAGSFAQGSLIAAPEMEPDGATGFVGSVNVTFANPRSGTIHYTLDGSTPTARSEVFDPSDRDGIVVDRTLTLKAIRRQLGLSSSVASAEFVRAKLPAPKAAYGGKTSFYPTLACTLSVSDVPSAVIRYTVDGTAPGASSARYSAPLSITKTTTLSAYASATGYDDGGAVKVTFTLTEPPATPVAVPASQAFATASIAVKVRSATAGALVRWSIDPSAKLDTATLLGGDSIVTLRAGKAGDIINLRAQAFKSGHPSSAVMAEKYTYLPQVEAPVASRAPGFFYDSAIVALGSATEGAAIRYTLDGTAPTEANSRVYTGPINLSESVTIRAYAAKPPQPQSAYFTGKYDLRLERPQISLSSRQYKDSLPVRISSNNPGASLFYTLDGSMPTAHSAQAKQIDTIVISGQDSTALTVIAVKGTVQSDPSKEVYVKTAQIVKLPAPIVEPSSREFLDTLRITLRASETGAVIRYTLDSSMPTAASPRYEAPFLLDSTAVVRARSFPSGGSGGLEAGPDRMERYVLTPSTPIPHPTPGMRYVDSVKVELRTNTKGGVIRYAIGDDILDPQSSPIHVPGKPILIFRSSLIQAVTVLGTGPDQRVSNTMAAHYEVQASAPSDTLHPGRAQRLPGNLVFTNAGESPVVAKMSSTEGLNLIGFKDAEVAVTFSTVKAGAAFKVAYAKPAELAGSLYRLQDGGQPEFITADNVADLAVPGVYFVGIDTMPPTIALLSQSAKAGDSTVIILSINDNVANPSCDIRSPGLPEGRLIRPPDAQGKLTVGLKNPATDIKGLWFRAAAKDFYNSSRLPQDPAGKFYLAQEWSRLKIPPVLNMGREEYPWDLGGFPISGVSPETWGQVRKANPDAGLQALVWSDPRQDYVTLEDTSTLAPGMGFWIASASRSSSLALSPFRAGESRADGSNRMVIRHGWNQVTSPTLDKMYWPVTPADPGFLQSPLKGLHAFVPDRIDYAESDSLEPWKGYFVYYYGMRDTLITLLTEPPKRPAAKASAFRGGELKRDGVRISLDFGRLIPLRLQARAQAQDIVASEDEPELPAWKKSFAAWSQRGSRRLKTDVVRFVPEELLQWKIISADSDPAHAHRPGSFRILEGDFPAGYQAWAYSSARNLKFPLEENGEIPISGMAEDTLTIFAGPLSKLSTVPELARASASVERLAFSLQSGLKGMQLRLSLPKNARVEAEIRSLSGRLLCKIRPMHLAQGVYNLPLGKGEGSQMGVLLLRLQSGREVTNFSKPLIW